MTDKQMIDLEDLDHITSVTEAITSFRELLDIMYDGSTTFNRTIGQKSLQESLEFAAKHLIKEFISLGFQPSPLNENESLKGALKVTPGVVTKEDLEWAHNTLASLKSKGEEE